MFFNITFLTYSNTLCTFSIVFLLFNNIILLTLNLTPIFKARGIDKPYTFLVKAGLSPHSANSIINSKTRIFKLDHIELLCSILTCEPNDLLVWTPNKGQLYPENNPLLKLKLDDINQNLQEALASMPFKQLKEITKSIFDKENG